MSNRSIEMKTALYLAISNLMDVVEQERLLRTYFEQSKSEVVLKFQDVRQRLLAVRLI